ncbi:MAG: HAD-IA family hydrolase [Phycisphaeraceae bacterium]|nr:HAD-IA family hydrolase [Phycisphaeraceae bacterium]
MDESSEEPVGRAPIELVCFDLGGVLIQAASGGWIGACQRAGVPIRQELERLRSSLDLERFNNDFETGRLSVDRFVDKLAEVTLYEPSQLLAIFRSWLVGFYPGIESLLKRLADTPVELSCLSNTNPVHWQHLITHPQFKPLEGLHHRFASHLIGARKPDLEAYEHVENELDIDPETILFFDDMTRNCVAARENYWNVVRIDSKNDPAAQIEKALRRYKVLKD